MGNACSAGLTLKEFWEQTPYETRHVFDGYLAQQAAAYQTVMFGAWHAAGFQRAKRMPKLARILSRMSKKRDRNLTPEQVWEAFKLHNVRLEGRDERRAPGH